MEQAVILDGVRTAFGTFGGTIKDISATELGVITAKKAMEKAGVNPSEISESIYGNVVPSEKNAIYLARHIG